MVGEFPELQGLMGRYYANAQGEEPSVAEAIEEHYKPQGPNDRIPTSPVSIAVALADKLDTLVGFWAIDEKPTGSKDPYALRRAALGVIRIVLENELRAARSIDVPTDLYQRNAYRLFAGENPMALRFEELSRDQADSVDLQVSSTARSRKHWDGPSDASRAQFMSSEAITRIRTV